MQNKLLIINEILFIYMFKEFSLHPEKVKIIFFKMVYMLR